MVVIGYVLVLAAFGAGIGYAIPPLLLLYGSIALIVAALFAARGDDPSGDAGLAYGIMGMAGFICLLSAWITNLVTHWHEISAFFK